MSEKQFQSQVIALAKLCGWLTYHTFDSRRSAAGFPDLVLVRGNEILYAELKSDKGKATAAQLLWLTALSAAGCRTHLWRPSDWPEIQAILTAPRRI